MENLTASRPGLPFAKGHGTGNDFVIVPDPDGQLELPADLVVALCDRRRGVGGDGVLRVVRTSACAEGTPARAGVGPEPAEWFMDYRNRDGSLAEMCGNGVRVYVRYLVEAGLAAGPRVPVLTRAGRVVAEVGPDAISVDMPVPSVYGQSAARVSGVDIPGTVVVCGNPNLVCRVAEPDALDLLQPPGLDPGTFPGGANVEFVSVAEIGEHPRARMRVVERGVGETYSCGSGACAAAAVVLRDAGLDAGTVTVEVPGGRLTVALSESQCRLAGPAVIVATGRFALPARSPVAAPA